MMRIAVTFLILIPCFLTSACELNMRKQKKVEPFEANSLWKNEQSARPQIPGTIPRGELRLDAHFYTGRMDGLTNPEGWKNLEPRGQKPAGPLATYDREEYFDTFPFEITMEVLERGRERFDIYCAPCHGRTGYGDGMIVQRGFPPPPSYHIDRLREDPPGRLFSVITNGYGNMYSYASRVSVEDRWSIVAYIRALQRSQNVPFENVPPPKREELLSQQ